MLWGDFVVCLCFGWLGIHKFREKKILMGIVYLLTVGLFGIGWLIDSVMYFVRAVKGLPAEVYQAPNKYTQQQCRQLAANDPLPVYNPGNLIMSEGELCHYYATANFIKTKNVVVGYEGGSSGVNIRVMKGVSYRVGQSRSVPVRGDVHEIIPGLLRITNKRIIFSGAKASFDKKITTLSALTPYNDGMTMQFGDRQYTIMCSEAEYVYQIITRIINTQKI